MTFVEHEVFAFLDTLRATGVLPPYAPRVVREYGLSGDRAMALCAKWIVARDVPTDDERAGMDWWNALAPDERAMWLTRSGAASAAGAWAHYKREQQQE